MLDSETKRRIDTARDILVGKVPDPKSQVEQITIALIYKFMDDMDQESISMGGTASFFTGDYERFAWHNIFDPHHSGFEMLNLYAEALQKLDQSPTLPQLFRDIFKNAFLLYRDPETLKLFLKTIDEFSYDQSERLGDAFEYLLLVLGAQGDAGQFLTPRHIINFMVQVVKPQKYEVILDPACGTAGFLISAYRYILNQNSANPVTGYSNGWTGNGDLLSPQERTTLMENFNGYDISPDMVRLSRVNLYLHGFPQPKVFEYDTLTSEEKWNDFADVILANPPFMSPKGGIKPHKRFGVQSNRSEVLFVDYIAEHLKPGGRAAVIVPEGIIFQSGNAYKQLRKYLVEQNLLWAVVSLPAGVFNPYSGVKTSILFMDRNCAKLTDKILFIKITTDGFDLGAQRRKVDFDDLPNSLCDLDLWKSIIASDEENFNSKIVSSKNKIRVIRKSEIGRSGDYILSFDRYSNNPNLQTQAIERVNLGEVAEFIRGVSFRKEDQLLEETKDSIRIASTKAAQEIGIIERDLYFIPRNLIKDDRKKLRENDILISTANSLNLLGRTTFISKLSYDASFGAFMTLIRPRMERIEPIYLLHCLRSEEAKKYYISCANTTTNISNLT